MTKSKGKGGKNRRKCKRSKYAVEENRIEFKEIGQDYARVLERKGGPIVTLKLCSDEREVLGVIRGKMRKRSWISSGDIVLVSLREFQKDKVDILFKYSSDNIRKLIVYGELTNNFVNNNNNGFFDNDIEDVQIDFVDLDAI